MSSPAPIPSDTESEDSFYAGSDGDQDEIARELDDGDHGRSDNNQQSDIDSEDTTDEEDDLPTHNAQTLPSLSSDQPSTVDSQEGISPLVLIVLQSNYTTWKAEKGKKRKQVWRSMLKELRALPENKTLIQSQWDLRGELYLRWMRRQGRKPRNKSGFFAAPKWTVRRVVRQLKEKRIAEILQTVYGVSMGSAGMLEHYQKAVSQAIEELTPAELSEMQKSADEWNNKTQPDSAKAKFATRGMASVMKQFAEEMWKRGGVRMVMLTGYKDEENAWLTTSFDFNKDIDDGPTFHEVNTVQGPWDRYIRRCFQNDADSEESSGAEARDPKLGNNAKSKKPNGNLNAEAALQMLTCADGRIWIPEISGRSRSDLQALVRAYLTAHYRKVSRNAKISAPFKKLPQFQDQLFLAKHLPDDFAFPGDPSHMKTSEAKEFLEFIRGRQKTSPKDVFAFQYRLSRDGELEQPDILSSESDTEAQVATSGRRKAKKVGNQSSRPLNIPRKEKHAIVGIVTEAEEDADAEDGQDVQEYRGKGKGKVGRGIAKAPGGRSTEAATVHEARSPTENTSATCLKVGPPIGVKRTKEGRKAKSVTTNASAPRADQHTAAPVADTTSRRRHVSAGKKTDRPNPRPLTSVLKSSAARHNDEAHATTDPSHNNEANGHVDPALSQGPSSATPRGSVPTRDTMEENIESLTPRRSNRERRPPARVDEEEPTLKRQAPSKPLTTQFKAKRARFN